MRKNGFSLIEVVLVAAILLALSALAIPSAEIAQVRLREKVLHERLKEMRQAIDRYQASNNGSSGSLLPPSIASLTQSMPASQLKAGADSGPYLLEESMGNPFTPQQDTFIWDIRDSSGTWHQNQINPGAQLTCYDVRFPQDGVSGWKMAINDTFYENW